MKKLIGLALVFAMILTFNVTDNNSHEVVGFDDIVIPENVTLDFDDDVFPEYIPT